GLRRQLRGALGRGEHGPGAPAFLHDAGGIEKEVAREDREFQGGGFEQGQGEIREPGRKETPAQRKKRESCLGDLHGPTSCRHAEGKPCPPCALMGRRDDGGRRCAHASRRTVAVLRRPRRGSLMRMFPLLPACRTSTWCPDPGVRERCAVNVSLCVISPSLRTAKRPGAGCWR